ncbi:MAG: hypothetical protein AB4042_05040 [Leptolyngbyaceae cyanobacterium]
MKYLLDTDHLSILQRQPGEAYRNLSRRMASVPITDFAVSIITFHEQVLGCHAYINRSRSLDQVVTGYTMMARLLSDFQSFAFDSKKWMPGLLRSPSVKT